MLQVEQRVDPRMERAVETDLNYARDLNQDGPYDALLRHVHDEYRGQHSPQEEEKLLKHGYVVRVVQLQASEDVFIMRTDLNHFFQDEHFPGFYYVGLFLIGPSLGLYEPFALGTHVLVDDRLLER